MLPVAGLQKNWSASLSRELISSLQSAGALQQAWVVGDIAYADDGFGHIQELLRFSYEDVYNGMRRR
jgi:hypothetical protein